MNISREIVHDIVVFGWNVDQVLQTPCLSFIKLTSIFLEFGVG